METGITQEQRDQLATWASQRDSLLSEISMLKIEVEKLTKSVEAPPVTIREFASIELVVTAPLSVTD